MAETLNEIKQEYQRIERLQNQLAESEKELSRQTEWNQRLVEEVNSRKAEVHTLREDVLKKIN